MVASDIAAAFAPQVARHVRRLSVLHARPAFLQIPEEMASDCSPTGNDVRVVAFVLQVFGEP
jgi:hypothetical protein